MNIDDASIQRRRPADSQRHVVQSIQACCKVYSELGQGMPLVEKKSEHRTVLGSPLETTIVFDQSGFRNVPQILKVVFDVDGVCLCL